MRITREEADALGRKIGAAMRKAAPRAAPTRKEREIQAAILAYLRTVPGVVVWRSNVGAVREGERFVRFGFKGLSDIVGFRAPDGKIVCIEVKREGHFPTAEQQHFLDMVKQAGGIAICARNVSDVQRVLQP